VIPDRLQPLVEETREWPPAFQPPATGCTSSGASSETPSRAVVARQRLGFHDGRPARRHRGRSCPVGRTRSGPRGNGSARSAGRSGPAGRVTTHRRRLPSDFAETGRRLRRCRGRRPVPADFTVNAMACPCPTELIIRSTGRRPAAGRLRPAVARGVVTDDPLRMSRAARFIAGYGLHPTKNCATPSSPCANGSTSSPTSASATSSTKLMVVDSPVTDSGSWSRRGWRRSSSRNCPALASSRIRSTATRRARPHHRSWTRPVRRVYCASPPSSTHRQAEDRSFGPGVSCRSPP